jgi:hypothetical protein
MLSSKLCLMNLAVKIMNFLGTCVDDELIEDLFGSVSEFARLVEEFGDNFGYKGITVKYDQSEDIHIFYR